MGRWHPYATPDATPDATQNATQDAQAVKPIGKAIDNLSKDVSERERGATCFHFSKPHKVGVQGKGVGVGTASLTSPPTLPDPLTDTCRNLAVHLHRSPASSFSLHPIFFRAQTGWWPVSYRDILPPRRFQPCWREPPDPWQRGEKVQPLWPPCYGRHHATHYSSSRASFHDASPSFHDARMALQTNRGILRSLQRSTSINHNRH